MRKIIFCGAINATSYGVVLFLMNINHWYLWIFAIFAAFYIGSLLARHDCRLKKRKLKRSYTPKWFIWLVLCLYLISWVVNIKFFTNATEHITIANLVLVACTALFGWVFFPDLTPLSSSDDNNDNNDNKQEN